ARLTAARRSLSLFSAAASWVASSNRSSQLTAILIRPVADVKSRFPFRHYRNHLRQFERHVRKRSAVGVYIEGHHHHVAPIQVKYARIMPFLNKAALP